MGQPAWSAAMATRMPLSPLLVRRVDPRGEDEIIPRQSLDLVGPELHAHLAPAQEQVGMMLLLLGNRADPVGELQRAAKIFERVRLLEMRRLGLDRPARGQLALQATDFLRVQRARALRT